MEPLNSSGWSIPNGLGYLDNPRPVPLSQLMDGLFHPSTVVDSGASFHATPDRKHFLDYVQGDFGQVQLGDNRPCKIVGMGNVKIKQ
jgi:hypothetical protein